MPDEASWVGLTFKLVRLRPAAYPSPDAFLMESLIDEVLADYKLAGKVDLELIYIGS